VCVVCGCVVCLWVCCVGVCGGVRECALFGTNNM